MSCSAGVCAPTAKNAVLNVTDLANLLQASDVKVTTGSGAITIEITAGLSWASPNRLTLDANCNVSVKAPVTVAGPGGLTVVTNDGGSGCDLLFFPGGKIAFWDKHSSLLIDGKRYKLESSLPHLAKDIADNPSGLYALANDYDASVDGAYKYSPIATFVGTFEGLGNTISHFTIKARKFGGGLFDEIGSGGLIRDFGLVEASVVSGNAQSRAAGLLAAGNLGVIAHSFTTGSIQNSGSEDSAGGLVGANAGIISDSYSQASVWAANGSGGLASYNTGLITACYASGTVSGYLSGGLVSENVGGTLVGSHATGSVYGEQAGGLAGWNSGSISTTFATGTVNAQRSGGLLGANGGTVDSSFATGGVTGNYQSLSGGLVGYTTGGSITNSYASGPVDGGADFTAIAGGLIGSNNARNGSVFLENSYSTGTVSVMGHVGGFIGDNSVVPGETVYGYWDVDTSGSDHGCGEGDCSGITGLTDAQLKSALPAGFDPAVWGQNANINNGYPYLLANPPPP